MLRHLQRRRCLTSGRWTVIYDGRDGYQAFASVPHRSTPQRLLVVLGRVEIYGSGAPRRRAILWTERV